MAQVELKGQIKRIVFVNPANGYTVAQVVPDDRSRAETVVGIMPSLVEGDLVFLVGERVIDRRFGPQIRIEHIEPSLPTSLEGTQRYLASGAVPGVGGKTAEVIVKFFGDALQEVLELTPERLLEIPGIGPIKAKAIAAAWKEKVTSRRLLVSLYGLGVGNALAGRLVGQYGAHAYRVVQDEPYRLAREVRGVGFLTADRLAQSMGIAPNDPHRIQAGILYYLETQSGEGHCFMPLDLLVNQTAGFLEVDIMEVEEGVRSLLAEGALREDSRYGDDALYLPRLYNAELDCAQALARLKAEGTSRGEDRLRKALQAGIQALRIDLTGEQVEAVWAALKEHCSIITGGPGTGKTTVIQALLASFRFLHEEVALCAPTGRAAKRMTETTGMEAKTIHRLLEFNPVNGQFSRDEHNPIVATAVIVDEVSMIDVELMASLLEALAPGTRLVLVGDKDQLESVGPGAVLRDLIASQKLPCARFTQIHRQAEESLIVVNAHRVLNGQRLSKIAPGNRPADFFFMERESPEACLETLRTMVQHRIPSRFKLDPIRDVQVISPMYKGLLGAQNLNDMLQATLNPHGQEITKGERVFRVGDRVMQIRNNYNKDVYNGDVGFVDGIAGSSLSVRMGDGRVVLYDDSDLDELTLAYAVTVHKSQGSEYPVVLIALHTQHYVMLRRNLLYTGMTRGKKLVVVVGSNRALSQAISNDQTHRRFTRLAERIKEITVYG
jgi:exodeoxyribonuclease V alpha subunit